MRTLRYATFKPTSAKPTPIHGGPNILPSGRSLLESYGKKYAVWEMGFVDEICVSTKGDEINENWKKLVH